MKGLRKLLQSCGKIYMMLEEIHMKKSRLIWAVLFFALLGISGASAQATLKGMSLNGSTGLYSIPSGRIGWERSSNLGLDFGYHAIFNDGKATHLPKMSMSLFKWVELSAAFDIQPDRYITPDKGSDFIGGAKIQFPFTQSAVALGGNFQALNIGNNGEYRYNAGQIYVAVSYAGSLFTMPAETTLVFGKTIRQHSSDWNIDFGMGFDLILLPSYLDRTVHWITDFANFSYSVESFAADAWYRGVLNTGFRVDLSVIPPLSKFKFVIDIMITDAFDDNRAFSVGAVFGVPIL